MVTRQKIAGRKGSWILAMTWRGLLATSLLIITTCGCVVAAEQSQVPAKVSADASAAILPDLLTDGDEADVACARWEALQTTLPEMMSSARNLRQGWVQYQVYYAAAGDSWPYSNMALLDDLWKRGEILDAWLQAVVTVPHPAVDAYKVWLHEYMFALSHHSRYFTEGDPTYLGLGDYFMEHSEALFGGVERQLADGAMPCVRAEP